MASMIDQLPEMTRRASERFISFEMLDDESQVSFHGEESSARRFISRN